MQKLPGISKISYVLCQSLEDDITYKAEAGIPVSVPSGTTLIGDVFDATCELDREPDNNSVVEKAKLKFSTTDEVPKDLKLAFVIETVNGRKFIIGAQERPYPSIKSEESTGQPDGDSACYKFTVAYNAKRALVPLE